MTIKIAVCVLSRYYNETWIQFLNSFTLYDTFFVIDDNSVQYPIVNGKTKIIQISNNDCEKFNYYNSSIVSNLPHIVSWDRALYYFNKCDTSYDHIWFLEEDVFIMSENVLENINQQYPTSDLLSAFNEINETGNIYHGWNHWINVIHRIGTPWSHSLISASRLSRRLMDRIDEYVQDRPLLFIEALFNTLALHNDYIIDNPDEMKETITYNKKWDREQIDKTKIYHPFKKIEDHEYIRNQSK